jgi:DNA-directed RNA polymerase I and III subunit RPAC1
MIGIHPSIANAFRRIILSEVPSMAIERVRMMNNTSILQDEFLAHRLGLIPIRADPSQFTWKKAPSEYDNKDQPTEDDPKDTLLFSLRVKRSPDSSSGKTPLSPKKRTASTSSKTTGGEGDEIHPMVEVGKDGKVLSSHIKWIPLPGQLEKFSADPPRPVHPDILIARLNPRQEIDCTLEVVKGEGGDHTKFSPVATASYRLLPKVIVYYCMKHEIVN